MRLVGASRLHIRAPFLLEGMIQGTLGASLALLLLFGAFRATLWQLQVTPGQVFGMAVILALPNAQASPIEMVTEPVVESTAGCLASAMVRLTWQLALLAVAVKVTVEVPG